MKTLIAVAISSFIVSGAYAQSTLTNNNKNQTYTNSTIDDTNRKAILEALGTNASDIEETKKQLSKKDIIVIKTDVVENKTPQQSNKTILKEVKPVVAAINTKQEDIKVVLPEIKKEPVKNDNIIIKKETPKVIDKNIVKDPIKKIEEDIKNLPTAPLAIPAKKEIANVNPLVKTPMEKFVPPQENIKTAKPIISQSNEKEEIKISKNHTKHIVKTKKNINKKQNSNLLPNEIVLTKLTNSVSEVPYELNSKPELHYLNRNEVKTEFTTQQLDNSTLLHFKLHSLINTRLNEEQFKKIDGAFANIYIVNNDLKNINKIDINPTDGQLSYTIDIDKKSICKAIFVQYHLRGEEAVQNFVTYIDSHGKLTSSLDNTCNILSFNTKDNLDYTNNNNILGIFINSNKNKNTLKYTIFNNKNGDTYIPENLQSYIVDKNFNYIYTAHLTGKNNMLGSNYETKLNSGSYYVVGQFVENNNQQSIITAVEVK